MKTKDNKIKDISFYANQNITVKDLGSLKNMGLISSPPSDKDLYNLQFLSELKDNETLMKIMLANVDPARLARIIAEVHRMKKDIQAEKKMYNKTVIAAA